jgi:hypothetical protein
MREAISGFPSLARSDGVGHRLDAYKGALTSPIGQFDTPEHAAYAIELSGQVTTGLRTNPTAKCRPSYKALHSC